MTIPEIIEKTYKPKEKNTERDNKILKHNLGILAELYFAETIKEKWGILSLNGFVCKTDMAIKSVLFDVKKRSSIEFDLKKESELFFCEKHHILYE